jgi:hypothetical protein
VETATYKAYRDNIKAKTGKDPEYFRKIAKEKGLSIIASYARGSNRIADWDTAMPTRSSCTYKTLNSPKRRYKKTQKEKKPKGK